MVCLESSLILSSGKQDRDLGLKIKIESSVKS